MAIHLRNRIASVFVLLLAAAGFVHIHGLPAGAAMFPRLVLGATAFLATLWLISTFMAAKRAVDAPASGPFIENPRNFGIFVATIVGYIALIEILGYFTSTAMFMLASSTLLGFRRHRFLIIATVAFIAFVYVIFVVLFKRPMPPEFFQA